MVRKLSIETSIKKILDEIHEPYTGKTIGELRAIKNVENSGNEIVVFFEFGFPLSNYAEKFQEKVNFELQKESLPKVKVSLTSKIVARAAQPGVPTLNQVKNIIAVASGKAGVGKSTTTTNLAGDISLAGANVGILDADIYGPSQTRMLGTVGKPDSIDGKKMEPIINYGIQCISIGNLINEDTPMIWRGPMATGALEQLLNETNWKKIDYLIVDLPPGTGDIHLTLCQKIPVTAALIVTTPQDIALLDAKKALKMFEKVKVPVLGIIENMSGHICSNCGHEDHIFGKGGAQKMASDYSLDVLGSLPIDSQLRKSMDIGEPMVFEDENSKISQAYFELARSITGKISNFNKDLSRKFPKIVVEDS